MDDGLLRNRQNGYCPPRVQSPKAPPPDCAGCRCRGRRCRGDDWGLPSPTRPSVRRTRDGLDGHGEARFHAAASPRKRIAHPQPGVGSSNSGGDRSHSRAHSNAARDASEGRFHSARNEQSANRAGCPGRATPVKGCGSGISKPASEARKRSDERESGRGDRQRRLRPGATCRQIPTKLYTTSV